MQTGTQLNKPTSTQPQRQQQRRPVRCGAGRAEAGKTGSTGGFGDQNLRMDESQTRAGFLRLLSTQLLRARDSKLNKGHKIAGGCLGPQVGHLSAPLSALPQQGLMSSQDQELIHASLF